MSEPNISPTMHAENAEDFLSSQEGAETVAFVNEFIILGHQARPWFSRMLNAARLKLLTSGTVHDRIIARMCELEIISGLYMTSEDIAAFCLAYEKPLEEIPRAVVNMDTREINKFYLEVPSWSDMFYNDLWLNPDPAAFHPRLNREWTRAIQTQNVSFSRFIFGELACFRELHSRLHNKYKHCFPLWLRFKPTSGLADRACAELVFASDDRIEPIKSLKSFIVGDHEVRRVIALHSMVAHFFETLLRSRLNWVRYDCKKLPRTVVYGKNPLTQHEWSEYSRIVRDLYPRPLAPWPPPWRRIPTVFSTVKKQVEWIHSKNAMAHWLRTEPSRFFLKA